MPSHLLNFKYVYVRLKSNAYEAISFKLSLVIHIPTLYVLCQFSDCDLSESSGSQSVNQSASMSVSQSVSVSVSQSASQSVNQSVSQSVCVSMSQSISECVRESVSQSLCP